MSEAVVAAVLLAALMHAAWNALIKATGRDPGSTGLAGPTGLSLCWALLGWPLVLWVGPLSIAAWPMLVGSIIVHIGYFSLLAAAYQRGDLSLVYPIARGLPPLLVVLATALGGERLSGAGTVGVVAIAAGVLLLQRRGAEPWAVALAVASALCTTVYTLLDAQGVRTSSAPLTYTLHLVALQGTLFAGGALCVGRGPLLREVMARKGVALASGILSAGGYAVALWAMGHAPIAAVSALRETSVAFAAVFAFFLLGEPFDRRRILATALIVAGAVAVRAG